ncbi:uncharacterized protein MONBRDRAFT_25224 [Monosiga brevicollis MX1]|uniref:U2A'/phosphoprotein 32 family A C-terminal domain-containing protein n=1 Tax=Monosiga brevicollis TaxID=81824 RepID=A9UYS3_MONBE|nr:uncharacterized protein MONBRDRAFT_25224 [Monosiga brevicollis MX1]EDQ89654.1 predicted protein [Monosiga brevicollis MX1]|eukprot:XP_001745683.1 hypothetical protein [Monosiga brevicollis MX1]
MANTLSGSGPSMGTGVALNAEAVLAKTRADELEAVKHLNCWGSKITSIALLRHMPAVEVVSLSQILAFDTHGLIAFLGINPCLAMRSVNAIQSLRPLQSCTQLQELYLRKNQIADLREILYLKDLPQLTVLWMSDNPVAEQEDYRATVIKYLPHLTKLDNLDITPTEREEANKTGRELVPFTAEEESQASEDDASLSDNGATLTAREDAVVKAIDQLCSTLSAAALQRVAATVNSWQQAP